MMDDLPFGNDMIGRGEAAVLFTMGCLHRLVEQGMVRSGEDTYTLSLKGSAMFDQVVAMLGERGEEITKDEIRSCLLWMLTNGPDAAATEGEQ